MIRQFSSAVALAVLAISSPAIAQSPAPTADALPAPVASTQYGQVQGAVKEGVNVFLGIPYGADTSTTRFQPANTPEPWEGVLQANMWPDMTPQLGNNSALFRSWQPDPAPGMSENMLGLNIWTPGLDDRKRPVMVWLHGGGFQNGNGSSTAYEGVNLANRGDVVVVTINHRLNAFGHLYLAGLTDDPTMADSGNVGSLDMVLALEWVRDNIANFGGNPDNVLIFGESGGGRKVSTLLAMPGAEGLFHRAIVQSGSHLKFREPEEATEQTLEFLGYLGIEADELDKLDDLTQDDFMAGLRAAAADRTSSLFWSPVRDGRSLPYHPWEAPGEQPNADVPMLIGSNKDELSLWLVRPGSEPELSYEASKSMIGSYVSADEFDDFVAGYREAFPDYSDADIMVAIASDARYSSNAVRQAKKRAEAGGAPAWLYQFDWETPVLGGIYGAPHALEIPFAFDTLGNSESMVGDPTKPQKVADQVSEAWISFARHGDPNARGLPFWPSVTTDDVVAMRFNMVSEVDEEYFDAEGAIMFKGE
ncbi:MAG: carboxylesterase [Ponticaulis sp.]|nr:carboxylesterase [Ponticaulis sp.]